MTDTHITHTPAEQDAPPTEGWSKLSDDDIKLVEPLADPTPTHEAYPQSIGIHTPDRDTAEPVFYQMDDGRIIYGVPPLRTLNDDELTRGTSPTNPAIIEMSDRFGELDYHAQTIGPGLDELPNDTDPSVPLSSGKAQNAFQHMDDLLCLPHPKYVWPSLLLTTAALPAYYKTRHLGMLVKEGTERRYCGRSNTCTLWRTDEQAWARAYSTHSRRNGFPCGHSGLKNHGDGWYGCTNDTCPIRYSRELTEELTFA